MDFCRSKKKQEKKNKSVDFYVKDYLDIFPN